MSIDSVLICVIIVNLLCIGIICNIIIDIYSSYCRNSGGRNIYNYTVHNLFDLFKPRQNTEMKMQAIINCGDSDYLEDYHDPLPEYMPRSTLIKDNSIGVNIETGEIRVLIHDTSQINECADGPPIYKLKH
jgi:hypothetical protein